MKRKPGRPRKEPEPEPVPAIIEVWDERPYLSSTPKLVGKHDRVPGDWTTEMILGRFGIGDHLTVYRSASNETRHVVHGPH